MRTRDDVIAGLEEVLNGSARVSGASYFGSVAGNRCDSFSDIDLVVRCDTEAASDVVSGLHATLGIVLFRPFSEDRRPGGRYWFAATNPFARLDVSFYEAQEFDDLLVSGRGFAQPPFRSIPIRHSPAAAAPPEALPEWSQLDSDFAGALRQFHESVKEVARGLQPKRAPLDAEQSVREFHSRGLRPEIWDLYGKSLQHIQGIEWDIRSPVGVD